MTATNEVISRADAKARGLAKYFTGKPCSRGGIALRLTSSGQCRCDECMTVCKKSERRWRNENPGKKARCNAKWHANNADHVSEYKRRHAEDNREQYAANRKAWSENNGHVRRAAEHKRRAGKLNATPIWFGELDDFAAQEASDLCRLRAAATGFDWHVDHMIPLQAKEACGLHCAANLQVIPARLNVAKKNKMKLTEPREWLR